MRKARRISGVALVVVLPRWLTFVMRQLKSHAESVRYTSDARLIGQLLYEYDFEMAIDEAVKQRNDLVFERPRSFTPPVPLLENVD